MTRKIIQLALSLTQSVAGFVQRAKAYCYAVALLSHRCPACNAHLVMVSEGCCRCESCGEQCDPTIMFQTCTSCGGQPILRTRRYRCSSCGGDIVSRFLFNGLIFDAEYFRQKMAEHRQRTQERRERVRKMFIESRSGHLQLPPIDLECVPGLLEDLSTLSSSQMAVVEPGSPSDFDLRRYEAHVNAHISQGPSSLEDIPSLSEDARNDRIWRFIALIFLAHAGVIDIWQDGPTIMVIKRETDREGQGIPGEFEDVDGIEGSVGRVEA